MAPGLAGFRASSAILGSDDSDLAEASPVNAVLAGLGEGFTLVPEPRAPAAQGGRAPVPPRRRTWLDTFDWRLFRAGLRLEYIALPRGGELRLTARQQLPPVVQAVTGWQPGRPHLAHDLPAGPVADRVVNVIGPRALLPVATVTTSVDVTRVLNEDAKTVARLLIEYPVLTGAGEATAGGAAAGNGQPLAPRLTIAEVRGYPGPARRVARVIGETPGITPAGSDLLTEALAVGGRRPGDYTNKVDPAIVAGMPASQAVAVILLRLLDMAEVNVPGVLRDVDTEFLHDFRVAVRRTRAALKLFGDALGRPADTGRFAAEFKWLGDLTTPTRDLDVHLLGFEDMAATLKAAKPDDLEPFRDYLRVRRAKEYRALARGLRTPRFRELAREWRDTLTPVSAGASRRRPKGPGISAASLAAESTRKAFVKVARMGGAINPDSPPESLHNLRKRCKELRYALEFFAPLYAPAPYGRVVGDLKRLQDCLGVFQDTEVQVAEIRSLATAMLAANEAPAVTLLAMGEVTAGLTDGKAVARADFGRRFGEFAGTQGRRRMSALLRGETE